MGVTTVVVRYVCWTWSWSIFSLLWHCRTRRWRISLHPHVLLEVFNVGWTLYSSLLYMEVIILKMFMLCNFVTVFVWMMQVNVGMMNWNLKNHKQVMSILREHSWPSRLWHSYVPLVCNKPMNVGSNPSSRFSLIKFLDCTTMFKVFSKVIKVLDLHRDITETQTVVKPTLFWSSLKCMK